MTVGEKIKSIRKERGITQKKLGELCGMNEVQIRQYEIGKANPKKETLLKIANALQTPIGDIMGWDYFDRAINVDALSKEATALDSVQAAYGKKAVELLNDFSQLNETGQEKAADYVSDLSEQPKYKKPPE